MAKRKTVKGAKSTAVPVDPREIETAIRVIRGQGVMLDADLARLRGVTTARLNEQIYRNLGTFPEDCAYQLTQQEFTALMSQDAISKKHEGAPQDALGWQHSEGQFLGTVPTGALPRYNGAADEE